MNFYRLLGVSLDSKPEDIKRAFYYKAKKFHPDVNPNSSTLFKYIIQAYQTLIDPNKRKEYEAFFSKKGPLETFSEKFMEILGFTDKPKKGTDINLQIKLSLKEAIEGVEKEILYQRRVICKRCDGCGFDEGSAVVECDSCKGGRVETRFGRFVCPVCFGRGFLIKNPCKSCKGLGHTKVTQYLYLQINQGVEDGSTKVFKHLGNAGLNGGEYGDLKVRFSVDFGVFEKVGDDILLRLKLPNSPDHYRYLNIRVPTGEKVLIEMPQEKPPMKIRLKGHGYSRKDGTRGDLILLVL